MKFLFSCVKDVVVDGGIIVSTTYLLLLAHSLVVEPVYHGSNAEVERLRQLLDHVRTRVRIFHERVLGLR